MQRSISKRSLTEHEIEQLSEDWKKTDKTAFYFHGKRFIVIRRDFEEGNFIVCQKGWVSK